MRNSRMAQRDQVLSRSESALPVIGDNHVSPARIAGHEDRRDPFLDEAADTMVLTGVR